MSSPASTVSYADDEECYSDDDSQYASFMDNDSLQNSDDDEYMPSAAAAQKHHNNGRQTFAERSTTSASSAAKDGKAVARMPTRRPNPSIHNRNALMARENRKKKKEHVQTLERDVDELRSENDTLRKLLQKRSTMVHRLRDERLYLKSIIANKTSIMSLLQTIRGNRLPLTSSAMGFMVAADDENNSANNQNIIAAATTAAPPPPQSAEPEQNVIDDGCNNDGTMAAPSADHDCRDPLMASALTPTLSLISDFDPLDYMQTPPQSLSSSASSPSASSPSAAAYSLTDSSVSPLHDMAFPDLPWDEDMCGETAAAHGDAFFVPRLSAAANQSETDTVDEEEEEDAEPKKAYGGDSADDDDTTGGETPAHAAHRTKVSHEHNYSHNHINEQPRSQPSTRSPSGHHRQRHTAPYTTYSTAEHLHRGGKVRPSAYATTAETTTTGPGICLHLSGGRVSLEFCSSCHRHAQNAWDEDE